MAKLEGNDSMVCAAQAQQIRYGGQLLAEVIEDPQTHVLHIYAYQVDGVQAVIHNYGVTVGAPY
jgi:hypothetical protein